MKPLISIITPVYNGARYLEETIKSVLAQTYTSFEHICINDGSKDESLDILNCYCERIRVIDQENHGVAYTRNKGMRLAQGDYVLFLDQDDLLEPDYLEQAVRALADEDAFGVVVNGHLIDSEGRKGERLYQGWKPQLELDKLFYKNQIYTPAQVLMNKEKLLSIQGFDDKLAGSGADDWDLWIRVLQRDRLLFLNTDLMNYRLHDNNNFKNLDQMLRNELAVLEKFADYLQGSIGQYKSYRYLRNAYQNLKYLNNFRTALASLRESVRHQRTTLLKPSFYFVILFAIKKGVFK